MQYLWGGLLIAVGAFLFVSAITESDFIVYRILAARSRVLWGEKVHVFYLVAGVLVVIFGALVAAGAIGSFGTGK